MSEQSDPTTPEDVDPMLAADIESAFDNSVNLPDDMLPYAVEAVHAFLDALTPKAVHDERMHALVATMDELPPADRTNEALTQAASDLVRCWIIETRDLLLGSLRQNGQDASAIWVFHATRGMFLQWVLSIEQGVFPLAAD